MLLFILLIDKFVIFKGLISKLSGDINNYVVTKIFFSEIAYVLCPRSKSARFFVAHAPIAHSVILKSLYAPSRITYTYKLRTSIFYRVMIAKARTTMKHRNHDGSLTILRFIFYCVYMNVRCTLIFHNPIEVIIRRRKELEQFY